MKTMDEFCWTCDRKLFVAKIGQDVIELTERGEPYKVMSGDMLECPKCGLKVVTRFGNVTAQHEADFDRRVESARDNGCIEVV